MNGLLRAKLPAMSRLAQTILRRPYKILFAITLVAQAVLAAGAPVNVIYPRPETENDARNEYYTQVLVLVLKKSGGQYQAVPNKSAMGQSRAILQLENNDGLDVIWTMTSREREAAMLPVRIPIDKGLLGWRIFLVKKRDLDKFDDVHSLDDLKKYSAGQGHDWPDAEILRANGLPVVTGGSYAGLFRMLQADRFQYFPRGILEIVSEKAAHPEFGLEIEPTLLLHYPAALYFFVNKKNIALAQILERGLAVAIEDGSFDKLFEQFNGELIKQAHLKTRHVIEVSNPLPDETPLSNVGLWFRP